MASFDALGDPKYVSLTTFRKTGIAVPTAVWAAPEGDGLVVTTLASAGKVKRIRNNPAVTLEPCSMRGTVKPDAPVVAGVAEVIEEPDRIAELSAALAKKYGLQYKLALSSRRSSDDPARRRVIIRITPVE